MRFIEPMRAGAFYHIYNRGINGELLFRDAGNYQLFLQKLQHYLHGRIEILAYCLLDNQFHLLIYIKQPAGNSLLGSSLGLDVSRQFSHLFNAYAQSFNRLHARTGGLFESPFRRKQVSGKLALKETYLRIHLAPVSMGYVSDFREWPYASYRSILEDRKGFLSRNRTMDWFDGKHSFVRHHENKFFSEPKPSDNQRLRGIPIFGL